METLRNDEQALDVHIQIFDNEAAQALLEFIAGYPDRIQVKETKLALKNALSMDEIDRILKAYESNHSDMEYGSMKRIRMSLRRAFGSAISADYISLLIDKSQTLENNRTLLELMYTIRGFGEKRMNIFRVALQEELNQS